MLKSFLVFIWVIFMGIILGTSIFALLSVLSQEYINLILFILIALVFKLCLHLLDKFDEIKK